MISKNLAEKKIFLLDAYALIYRSYFAFSKNPRINSKGLNTSAIFGFTTTLIDILKNENPTHVAVVFDPPTPPIRVKFFVEYKANREKMPEDILISIPYIKSICQAFNIPILMVDGYEADDVIGTIAKKLETEGFTIYMMTPDKDYAQLVSNNIFIYKPARMGNKAEIWGIEQVLQKFEIQNISQVIDVLAMWGDAVDNVPGIPGVGEKTAKKFVKEYGSLEGLYENIDKLKGKQKENVEKNKEQAFISKFLVTIVLDVKIEFNVKDLKIKDFDIPQLKKIFEELEFRALIDRVFSTFSSNQKKETRVKKKLQQSLFDFEIETQKTLNESETTLQKLEDIQYNYTIINSIEQLNQFIEKALQQEKICFDTETTSLHTVVAELVGISFSWKKNEAYYIPINSYNKDLFINKLKLIFENKSIEKIGQNLKYDISVLKKYELNVEGPLFDTLIAHYLLNPDMNRRNLDTLSIIYLNYKSISIEELIGKKGKNQINMRDLQEEEIYKYACEDADTVFQLSKIFRTEIEKDQKLKILFETIEIPLINVLSQMELEGVNIDKQLLHDYSIELQKSILSIKKLIYDIAGVQFNIASPKQVGEILFEKIKIVENPKKTKTGQYATNEEILQSLKGTHEIVDKILDYRELNKLKNTYVDTLPKLIQPKTNRLHTTYNQTVASTGRLSSDNPNLQNIPIRTEKGRKIREAFIPKNQKYTILSADYSQIELRIIAALSNDEQMIQAFQNNIDIHTSTASKVYDIPIQQVTKEMRNNAKTVNFGIIYGISVFGLSQRINIRRIEAKKLIENYFLKFPRIKEYINDSIEKAKEKGYAETLLGRKRYLKDIYSQNSVVRGFAERNAVNTPIQGTAADMIKIAMIKIQNKLNEQKFKSKMILQVHDELIFDTHIEEIEIIKPIIKQTMCNTLPLNVPIEVEINNGKNWLEAH